MSLGSNNHTRMVYINKGDHDNLHVFPRADSEGSQGNVHHVHAHIDILPNMQPTFLRS